MAKTAPKTTPLGGIDELQAAITEKSTTSVVILDVHEEWCGSTAAAMGASMLQIFSEYEESSERIFLCSIETSAEVQAVLKPFVPDVKFDKQGCRPLYIVFRNGACCGFVDGVNVPSIAGLIKLWIPPVKKAEEDA
jgi:hypothetical protein